MGLEFSPEVWATLVVAAGFGGWIVGSLYGAGHGSIASSSASHGEIPDLVFSPIMTPNVAPQTSSTQPPPRAAAGKAGFPYANVQAGLGRPKDAAAEAFCIDEIRAQARSILHSSDVWHTGKTDRQPSLLAQPGEQDSTELLNQYLGSIEELRRANDRRMAPRRVSQTVKTREANRSDHQQCRLL